jgi:hypothetical protein
VAVHCKTKQNSRLGHVSVTVLSYPHKTSICTSTHKQWIRLVSGTYYKTRETIDDQSCFSPQTTILVPLRSGSPRSSTGSRPRIPKISKVSTLFVWSECFSFMLGREIVVNCSLRLQRLNCFLIAASNHHFVGKNLNPLLAHKG